MKTVFVRSFAALALAALVLPALAQQQAQGAPTQEAGKQAQQPPDKQEPPKDKNIDETVKDYEKITGVFTFYRKKKGASDSLMLEIPESQLNKLVMMQVTASSGTGDAPAFVFQGEPIADLLFRFELVDDGRVNLLAPYIDQRAPSDKPTERSLSRKYTGTILASYEVKARQEDRKSVLIDVSDLFKSEISGINLAFEPTYSLDRAGSYVDTFKAFPENMVATTVYKVNKRQATGPGPKSFPFSLTYNVFMLPETDYKPRLGDTRVGYFVNHFDDMSDPRNLDPTVNYIVRWNLEKADPSAALSRPKKPIVFWLDNAIPQRYRSAVAEGVLMWNPAFEKLGFKDAIEVKQMPDDADWDVGDLRYNTVRWTTGVPFAIALMRSNPLTGEVINACIGFDAVFATSGSSFFDNTVDPAKIFAEAEQPPLSAHDRRFCNYGHLATREANFGLVAADLLSTPERPFDKDDYIHQFIREVMAHEMGHVLGLRHNFTASTAYSMDQLEDASLVKAKGVTSTVMEYSPPNISALRKPDVPFYSPVIGDYDFHAIDYGYRQIDARTPEGELPTLRKIASKGNHPALAFQTDDVTNTFDPHVVTFDLGRDPLDWTARNYQSARHLIFTLGSRKPATGESFFEFTRHFNSLLSRYVSNTTYVARFIGGLHMNSNYKGDDHERMPLTPASAQDQKRALAQLNQYVFAENAFAFPKTYFSMLSGNPNVAWNQPTASQREFPMFTTFAQFQRSALLTLFTGQRLSRVANNEFRLADPKSGLTMAELYHTVGAAVWSELDSGKEISGLRRSLQTDHLNVLIDTAMRRNIGAPADAMNLSWSHLRNLRGRIAKALPSAKGPYGQTHLQEALNRIDRTLQAQVSVEAGT